MEDDDAYFARRAQQELGLERSATDPAIKALHSEMFERYSALLARSGNAGRKNSRPFVQHIQGPRT